MASAEPRSPGHRWVPSEPVAPLLPSAPRWCLAPCAPGDDPRTPQGTILPPHSAGPPCAHSPRTRLCWCGDPQQPVHRAAGRSAPRQRRGAGCRAAAPKVGPAPRQSAPAHPGAAVTACPRLSPVPFSLPGSVHAGGTDTAPRCWRGEEHQGAEQRGKQSTMATVGRAGAAGSASTGQRTACGSSSPPRPPPLLSQRAARAPDLPRSGNGASLAGALCDRAGTVATAPGDEARAGAQTTRMPQRLRSCARLEKMTLGTTTCSILQT